MEQNIDPRNKLIPLWSINLRRTKEARLYNGEKTVSSVNGVGKTGQLCTKE